MGIPCQSVCSPWATVDDVCAPCDDDAFDLELLEDTLAIASDILYALSGHRFAGVCQDTVRPNAQCNRDDRGWSQRNQRWGSAGWPSTGTRCCSGLSQVSLGGHPLTSIVEVKVDGEVLDSSLYRIDENRWLVRLPDADGSRPRWPCCQDLALASTEVDTFEVTFTYGVPPPAGGVRAAAALGCELALACQPETTGACRLNPRVTQLDRQGLSMVISNPADFFPDGRTGLPEVDLWLAAENPHKIRREATVLSPDIGPRVRRVGT
jgi:hypothetical protein